MARATNPIPDGYHTVTPYLRIRGAAKAIEFYKKAFGAQEICLMPGPGGQIGHAEVRIGDSMVMLGDEFPHMQAVGPQTLGGTSVGIHLYVPDTDAAYNRAVAAGAKPAMPPADMFWGDRFAKVIDPFGHEWSIGTHIEDVSPEEMEKRGKEAMEKMGQG